MSLVDWKKPLEKAPVGYSYCGAHKQWERDVAGGQHFPVLFQFWKPSRPMFRDDNPLGPTGSTK